MGVLAQQTVFRPYSPQGESTEAGKGFGNGLLELRLAV